MINKFSMISACIIKFLWFLEFMCLKHKISINDDKFNNYFSALADSIFYKLTAIHCMPKENTNIRSYSPPLFYQLKNHVYLSHTLSQLKQ